MSETREPIELAAAVVREAITCERTECTPEDHQRFVSENMRIASEQTARALSRKNPS